MEMKYTAVNLCVNIYTSILSLFFKKREPVFRGLRGHSLNLQAKRMYIFP